MLCLCYKVQMQETQAIVGRTLPFERKDTFLEEFSIILHLFDFVFFNSMTLINLACQIMPPAVLCIIFIEMIHLWNN